MSTGRKKKPVSFALDPAILRRLDEWLDGQDLRPTKTSVLEKALSDFLDAQEAGRDR